jgi:hypothetical protein
MRLTAETVDRLHVLHRRHVDQLRAEVISVNRSLGSRNPERCRLDYLARDEFEAMLTRPTDDPELVCLWVRRIIRGHESEFPDLFAGSDSRVPRRKTGA